MNYICFTVDRLYNINLFSRSTAESQLSAHVCTSKLTVWISPNRYLFNMISANHFYFSASTNVNLKSLWTLFCVIRNITISYHVKNYQPSLITTTSFKQECIAIDEDFLTWANKEINMYWKNYCSYFLIYFDIYFQLKVVGCGVKCSKIRTNSFEFQLHTRNILILFSLSCVLNFMVIFCHVFIRHGGEQWQWIIRLVVVGS